MIMFQAVPWYMMLCADLVAMIVLVGASELVWRHIILRCLSGDRRRR